MISLSKIIKNLCVAYDSSPRVVGTKVKILRPRKNEDVGAMLTSNALESADISLKHALRKALSVTEQSRIEAEIAYAASHKKGREKGYREGLEKGKKDGISQSEEKVTGIMGKFLAKCVSLDKNYKLKNDSVKEECLDFAFSLAENILGGHISREAPEFADIKNTYLSAQPQTLELEADGRILELATLKPEWIVESAGGIAGITVKVMKDSAKCEEENAENVKKTADENQNLKAEGAETNSAAASSEQESSKEVLSIPETFEEEENKTSDIKNGQTIVFPNPSNAVKDMKGNYEVPDDKLVYIRPSIKKAAPGTAENLKFEDLKDFTKENLKAILRKAEVEDMAALSSSSDAVSKALLDACPRKTKEKALDAVKYLGPVPQNEVERARRKIVNLAAAYLEREE